MLTARCTARAGTASSLPERLVGYRVRSDSMYQLTGEERLMRVREEATAQLDAERIEWTQ